MTRPAGRFVCELCGDVFTTNDELKEHIYAVHEIEELDA